MGLRPRWIRVVDDALFEGERALVVLLVAVMVVAVFLDALHRVFAAGEGRVERLLVALVPTSSEATARTWLAPGAVAGLTFLVLYVAGRTRQRSDRVPRRLRTAVWAAAGTTLAAMLVRALLVGLPNGLPWSQQLALCAMLWVGFLGASIAARNRTHLALEVAQRIWPPRLRPAADFAARAAACGFSLLLAALAIGFARFHYAEWAESDGAAGLFEGFPAPRFLVFGFLPLPLVSMGLRFLVHGVEPAQEIVVHPASEDPSG